MVKVVLGIGLIFLIAALTVFGSPFFAILLLVPAVMFYLLLVGTSAVVEDEPGTPDNDERDSQGTAARPGERSIRN